MLDMIKLCKAIARQRSRYSLKFIKEFIKCLEEYIFQNKHPTIRKYQISIPEVLSYDKGMLYVSDNVKLYVLRKKTKRYRREIKQVDENTYVFETAIDKRIYRIFIVFKILSL